MPLRIGDEAPDITAESTEGQFSKPQFDKRRCKVIGLSVDPVSDDQARQKYPEGWKTVKPYLRVLPQPRS